jgi:hypothetical protein
MGFTKREEKTMKDNGMHKSSSKPDTYVGNNGYGSATRSGNWTSFGNGDKKNDISLSRLKEKTSK